MPIINPININDFSNGALVHNRTTATLPSANWVTSNGVTTQTIAVFNMTSTATVWVSPQYDASINYSGMYATDQIVPIEQGADYITFRRYADSSSGDIAINIVWVEQGTTGSQTIILYTSDWSGGSQTKTIADISASTYVWISPTDSASDMENYCNAQIYCSDQTDGSLTFTYAGTTPTENIPVNVVWMDMASANSSDSSRTCVFDATDSLPGVTLSGHTIEEVYDAWSSQKVTYIVSPTGTFLVNNMEYNSSTGYSISALGSMFYSVSSIMLRALIDKEMSSSDTSISGLTKTIS